ncbi:PAS domain-containing hybrid sensor histidine kinase/response regulator [Notoacmeibacter sp. MSK16QG-6]|uniref:hybrid sensor histidine kinase/response regulator n=1 Tax=Notoacmeibacter sp. MSK16QG-6 TaxID=2957982 RepID=UPI00209DF5CD|nr:PAS domain-containing hybrid sensor histidine kinase/response regulator [Notoacmeibacter sp. MSK16QG-6]MCP1199070.1 ATP-binding protein [Notoacmeibacter sp. MSK16QG-6]
MKDWLERWRLFRLIPVVILLLGIVFSMLGIQMYREVSALRSAPQDNVQWTLAQIEIELLTLLNALRIAEGAGPPDPQRLGEARKRFDIFYSRNRTIAGSRAFEDLTSIEEFSNALQRIQTTLDRAVPLIDGDDATLFSALPELEDQFEAIRPTARSLSLSGVREFAKLSDARRQEFGALVFETAAVGLFLIIALIFALAVLFRQRRIAERRSEQIRESRSRYANTVDVSLDAIIVAEGDGTIIDFNPAAEKTFGYSRARAVGAEMASLIVPPAFRDAHRKGMQRFLQTGQAKLVGRGRFELDAMHADGSIFPVELSIGAASGRGGKPIFISYVRDISSRKTIEAELTSTRDRALAADKAKSQFLAVMSHEMRTPLNAVMATLDLLDRSRLDPKQHEFVQTAITSGEILQHHIDDVLDLTRIEAGAIDLKPTRFDIGDLIDEVRRSVQFAAEKKDNRISVDLATDDLIVCLDRNRLRQILLNLVGNAIKFTEGGDIRLRVDFRPNGEDGRTLEISVEDTGMGIARQDLARIFDDFVTLDASYKRKAEGYGLGLAICRRIAAAMGGKITVKSERGVGSTFVATLPEARAVQMDSAEHNTTQEPTAPAGGGLSVLLVEDNETNRFVARAMLEEEGCTVIEAFDGLDGVAKAEQQRFDLVLMDISMPRLDGIEATREIRQGNGASKRTSIVCLTAHAMTETRQALAEAGANDCLVKPLRRKNLRTILGAIRPITEGEEMSDADEAGSDEFIDKDVLAELSSLMPQDRFERSFDRFLSDLNRLKPRLARHVEDADSEATLKFAHNLAGSSGMFGAVALAEICRHIQDLASQRDLPSIVALLDDVDEVSRNTIAAYERAGWGNQPAPHDNS